MSDLQGFWSCVGDDDQTERGRISQLAEDVREQFQLITGEPLTLFFYKDALKWGDDWRDKINSSLALVAFFVPVLTPRYFLSSECRRELQFFARRASRLGVKELVLPLLYIDVPALHEDTHTDELIVLVRTFQWEDWRDARFSERTAEAYRRGVFKLATRLVEANRQAESSGLAATPPAAIDSATITDDLSPGLVDRLATTEEAFPKFTASVDGSNPSIKRHFKPRHF